MVRILIGGVVGGLLMFFVGAFTHMALDAESRHIQDVPSEEAAVEYFSSQKLAAGIYGFPMPRKGFQSLKGEEYTAALNLLNDRFKKGPAGYIIVAPTGQDMMGPTQLGGELLGNVIASILACLILANVSPEVGFGKKWLLLILLAPIAWTTLTLSQGLWYRFPMPFILDALWVGIAEWAVGGLAMVAIVRSTNKVVSKQPS